MHRRRLSSSVGVIFFSDFHKGATMIVDDETLQPSEDAEELLYTPSIEYLSYYVDEKGNIPSILINRIFDAVDLIEQLVKEPRDVTKCLLYKKDEAFKEKVDKEKELIKQEQAKAKAAKESL